jgi:adenylate kinase family enzyme
MRRIVVIGNAGGGKSRLCSQLGIVLGIEVFPVDVIQWEPGWVRIDQVDFQRAHDEILMRESWIIDGWGPWEEIEKRFKLADTIIYIDLPLYIHYWWSIKRQFMCIFRERPDGPPGCPMLPMTLPLLTMIWRIHFHMRHELELYIDKCRDGKDYIHLRSLGAMRKFLMEIDVGSCHE